MKIMAMILAAIILVTGCTLHNTKDIIDRLQPIVLYEWYGPKPVDLKALSKCPSPPTVNIVNRETREEDYTFAEPYTINRKELTNGVVEYLKYGFKASQIAVVGNSPKIIQLSFLDVKSFLSGLEKGGKIRIKVDIPVIKYSAVYEAEAYGGYTPFASIAYAIHGVTRKIIDDPVIQDYILCKAGYTDKSLSQKNGQGTFTYTDGSNYVGEFKDGKMEGQGTFTYTDGSNYVGEFKDGKMEGQGTFTFVNGNQYVGEFKDGKAEGQGTFTYANGNKVVGEFKDGKFVGQ